jgi:ferritin-like metal-binding protein YciE
MDYESLQDLFVRELKDLYSAEKQIIRALPKIIKHASSTELAHALEHHREETRVQAERLEQIFERLGKTPRGFKCKGVEGLLEETEDWLEQDASPELCDAGIIGQMQRVEHYEMAAYGTARAYANALGDTESENLLAQTLEEEGKADKKLTGIAEKINAQLKANVPT